MAHNSRIRPALVDWAYNSVVTNVEFNALDQAQFESINGDDGGAWAPAAIVEIGGAGLSVTGTIFDCSAPSTFSAAMTVAALATFQGAVICQSTVDISGNMSAQNGDFGGTLSVDGTATFNGSLSVEGGGTLKTPVVASLTGRIVRRAIFGANADTDYDVDDGDFIHVDSVQTNLTADRIYTLKNTNAQVGDSITFSSEDGTYEVTISKDGAGDHAILGAASTFNRSLTFVFFDSGSQWQIVDRDLVP